MTEQPVWIVVCMYDVNGNGKYTDSSQLKKVEHSGVISWEKKRKEVLQALEGGKQREKSLVSMQPCIIYK